MKKVRLIGSDQSDMVVQCEDFRIDKGFVILTKATQGNDIVDEFYMNAQNLEIISVENIPESKPKEKKE